MFATLRSISLLSPKTNNVNDESVKRKSSLAFTGDEATAVLAQLSTTKVIYYYDETNNNNNNTITTGVNIMMDKDTLLLLIQRVVV